jgi:hypothetical protein
MQMENSAKRQIVNDLIAEQVDAQTAERLADEVPEVCRRQLSYLDYQDDQEDRAATLVASIEGDWPEPSKSYWANVARQYNSDAPPPSDVDTAWEEATPSIVNELMAEQVDAQTAQRLADEVPEVCRRQLSYLDYQDDQEDRAATLVASIEGDWPEPSNSYWANVARQYSADAALASDADMAWKEAAPFQAQSSSDLQSGETSEPHLTLHQPAEVDVAVGALLAALETIATMQHAHREVATSSCPVCVAWDALKEWAHQQSLKGKSPDNASL